MGWSARDGQSREGARDGAWEKTLLGACGIKSSPNSSSRGCRAQLGMLPRFSPCHYLPPCLVVVEVH